MEDAPNNNDVTINMVSADEIHLECRNLQRLLDNAIE